MNIDVRLIPNAISEKDVRDRVVVVIDVLRSCSTIATAFANGAREVIPSPDMATASRIAANMDADRFRLGGEKEGRKIDGYHLGNSPLEYTADEVENRTIVFKSTNGTDAILMGTAAKHLVTASLLNAG
ncbi:MAG: 2-phosphosulfolactate phosphatase, partial [Bacteroidota bacterium]